MKYKTGRGIKTRRESPTACSLPKSGMVVRRIFDFVYHCYHITGITLPFQPLKFVSFLAAFWLRVCSTPASQTGVSGWYELRNCCKLEHMLQNCLLTN